MDQPAVPPSTETIDDVFDDVSRSDGVRRLERPGKEPVVVMSLAAYRKLSPLGAALEEGWTAAQRAGLDTMTMDEIDAEIAAYRRERKAAP